MGRIVVVRFMTLDKEEQKTLTVSYNKTVIQLYFKAKIIGVR